MKKILILIVGFISIQSYAQLAGLESTSWNLDSIHTISFGSLVRRNSSTGIWTFTDQGALKSQFDKLSQPVYVDYIIRNDTIIADKAKIKYKIEKLDNHKMELRIVDSQYYDEDNYIRYFLSIRKRGL